jgi:hypothetical protein
MVLGQAAESNSIFGSHRKAPENNVIFGGFFATENTILFSSTQPGHRK